MICKTYITTPNQLKLTKKLIIDNFGEKFKKYGFISKNNGMNWYSIKNGKILFSICFDEEIYHDIRYRAQPLCARLIHPMKKNKYGIADIKNYCDSALSIWKKNNPELYNKLELQELCTFSDEEFIQKKINFYHELLDKIVFPYFEKIEDFSDIVCKKDPWLMAAKSYLSGNSVEFYNNNFVLIAMHNVNNQSYPFDEINDFEASIREALENKDMSIIGKCLKSIEFCNIEYLKENFSRLFKSNDVISVLTDDFIKHNALTEVRTTYDLKISIPNTIEKIKGAEYLPFPMATPNPIGDVSLAKAKAEEIIDLHFSSELRARGFISRNSVFEWHKLVDDMLYYRLWFGWSERCATLKIYYNVYTLYDYIALDTPVVITNMQYAERDFLQRIDSPVLREYYPNAFDSGEEALKWKISRMKCQLYYVVFPYFDSITNLEELCKVNNGHLDGAIILGKDEYIPEYVKPMYRKDYDGYVFEMIPAKLPEDSNKWASERVKVLRAGFQHNNRDYILDYLESCREHNLKLLRKDAPDLFCKIECQ